MALAVIGTALIAAALPQLKLLPGIPLPALEGGSGVLPAEQTFIVASLSSDLILRAILIIFMVLFTIYNVYKLMKGIHWKDVFKASLSIFAVGTLILAILFILFALLKVRTVSEPERLYLPTPPPAVKGPPLGPLPPALIWLAWFGLIVVTILLGIWFMRWKNSQILLRDPFVLEAERALQALHAGADLKNVIIRCYRQMSNLLQKKQDIELEDAMTAREFERLLVARGIPQAPVNQLTRLFETARYSSRLPDLDDERKAVECLKAIVQYSREKKGVS
jgi:hypothetical protein